MKITCPTEELIKAIRACKHAMSPDETRPHLSSIWLRGLAGDRAHVFATSGHWLAVARLPGATLVEPGLANIQREDVARVLSASPGKSWKPGLATIACENHALSIAFAPGISLTLRSLDCSPPPIQDIIPPGKSPKKHARPTLSAELLRSVCAAAQEMASSKRGVGVRVVATGDGAWGAPQVIWSGQSPNFFAILMPMREDRKRDMAWWFDHAKAMADAQPSKTATPVDAAAE